MNSTCIHGAKRERHKDWADGFAWMESIGTCSCCGTIFCCWYGHIPEDRCDECGGREMTLAEAQASLPGHEPTQPRKTLAERLADYKATKRS